MRIVEIDRFPHRRNRDGTFDAICPRCYRTVATLENEDALTETEHNHVCEPHYLVVEEHGGSNGAPTDSSSTPHSQPAQ
jgi:hypothetical protein